MSGRRLPLLVAGFDAAWNNMTPWLAGWPAAQRAAPDGRGALWRAPFHHARADACGLVHPGDGRESWQARRLRMEPAGTRADLPHLQLHTSATVHGVPFARQRNVCGLRVGLVNIPLTFPTQPLDGFVLCGYPLIDPLRRYLYPPNLLPGLEAELGPYEPGHLEGMLASGEGWYVADERTQAFQVAAAIRLTAEVNSMSSSST